MSVKTFVANKGANRARQSGELVQSNGGDQHLVVGYASPFRYWAYARFALDWANVKQITSAVLVVTTRDPTAHLTAKTGTVRAWMLLGNFDDLPIIASEAYHKGAFNVPAESTTIFSAATGVSKVAGSVARINITSMVGAWAPKTVMKATGKPGLAKPNYGLAIEGITGNIVVASDIYAADPSERIKIELTYVPTGTPGTVLLDGPATPVSQIEGEFFTGTLTPGTLGDTIGRVAIQLYLSAGVVSEAGTEAKWKIDQPASASDRETGAFSVPLPALLRSGTAYKWRARVQNQNGVWTPWTATTPLSVVTEAPSLGELVPTGSLATLNAVDFGAHYHDDNANMLLTYRVQVRTSTLPTDPDWDQTELAWDSGDVPASLIEQFPTSNDSGTEQRTPQGGAIVLDPASGGQGGVIRVPYSGAGLGPGAYSYRIRATDDMGATSIWYYGDFSLTVGWEPDPGEVASPLTGYARRHVKSRVLIRGMDTLTQRVFVSKATGGTYKLIVNGVQTDPIAYNTNAVTMKARLEALASVSVVTVAMIGTYFTITFAAADQIGLMTALPTLLTGTGAAVYVSGTRAPGKVVAVIEDPTNLGVGEYFNSAGELFFSLPATHPQVSVIEPWEVHWAVEVFRGEGWKEIAAGLIIDFDATENDVVFHGVDYLGVLGMEMDERFNPTGSEKTPAGLFPAAEGGSYYAVKTLRAVIVDQLNRAIYQPGSKLGFLTLGFVPVMDEEVTIYSTFKQRLPFIAGLIQSHRAGTGKRTRLRVRKTITGGYEFRIDDDPGVDRDNIRFEYGGLVQGFRVIPFGDYGTRVNAIGRGLNSLKVEYYIALSPAPVGETASFFEDRYGRIAKVNLWQDISDRKDLIRRAQQMALGLGKLGKRVALGLRVGSLGPKDGWDIADSLLIDIKRGVVDTSRYGSGYWTVWGWSYRTFPDGHDDLTLSLLPREDRTAPDPDMIPSEPINPGTEWEIGYAPPVVGVTTGVLFYDASTGITWELDDLGVWVIRAGPGVPPKPPAISGYSRAVINPDGTTVANISIHVTPGASAAIRATKIALTATPGVWDANQIISDLPLGESSVAIENVRADTTYDVRAWHEDVFGASSPFSDVISFSTALDVTAPGVPTGLALTPGPEGFTAAWVASSASDIAGYEIVMSTTFGGTYVSAGKTDSNLIWYDAPSDVIIWVKVRAYDRSGNFSAYCTALSVTPVAVAKVKNAGAKVVIDASGLTIIDGKLTFVDSYGMNALDGYGFGPGWMRFITTRLYNSDFSSGSLVAIPASVVGSAVTLADYRASVSTDLPGWIVALAGSSLKLTPDVTGRGNILATGVSAAKPTVLFYQDIPVDPGASYTSRANWRVSGFIPGDSFVLSAYWSFRDANHALIGARVGGGTAYDNSNVPAVFTNTGLGGPTGGKVSGPAPSTAVYARFEVEVTWLAGATLHAPLFNDIAIIEDQTPAVWNAVLGNRGTSSGTTVSWWTQVGKVVHFHTEFTINAAGTGGGAITISLPVMPATGLAQIAVGFADGFATFTNGPAIGLINPGSALIAQVRDKNSLVLSRAHFVSGALVRMNGSYFVD